MQNATRWEQALIGTALAHNTEASQVTDVRPQDMECRSHQIIWTNVIDLDRGHRLSFQAVVEKLIAQGELSNIGADVDGGEIVGEMYLEELLSRRAQESIREFADQVIGSSVKREMKILGHLIALDADSDADIADLLDQTEEKIYALRRKSVDTGADIGQLLGNFETHMDAWRRGEVKPAFTFHTPGLSRIIPFLEDTDFALICGRPGEGKSSILRNEAFEAAKEGKKVVIFNLENSEMEYARYLVAHACGIDTWKLRQPDKMSAEEVAQAREAVRTLKSLPLRIVSLGAPSVYEIIRIMRKLLLEGFEIMMVDYLQLIKNGIENEVQDLTMTSSLLRGFSLKHHVPNISAAQLNREIVKRAAGAKPQLSDLRGSGSLEQDALIVAFNMLVEMTEQQLRNFPQNVNPDGSFTLRAVPLRVYVEKNRNGPVDRTPPMLWDKSTNRFYPLTVDQVPQTPSRRAPARQAAQGRLSS
jgi:replicative DNA helicase